MYGTPGRSISQRVSPRTLASGAQRSVAPSNNKQIPDGPILEFTAIIEDTPTDNWQKRCQAFHNLVELIPHGTTYLENGQEWYNTPTMLRHLAFPISELLKDARSTVVKRVCENLIDLFNKCQIDGRYLLKDLMATVLAVHAQTVHIIRQAVQSMILEAIGEVPCKMVMPLWMERLKTDKSRTVREACALYLGRALQCWSSDTSYLTSEIWNQVGTTLLKSLRDPSPHVRTYSRSALEYMQRNQMHHWDTLITDPNGPVAKDIKLQKWLRSLEQGGQYSATATNAGAGDVGEDLSIASRFSYNSDSRFTKSNLRISSPRIRINNQPTSDHLGLAGPSDTSEHVPFSIAVTHSRSRGSNGNGVPLPSGRLGSTVPTPTTTTTSAATATTGLSTNPFPQAIISDTPLKSSPTKSVSSTKNGYSSTSKFRQNKDFALDLDYSESNHYPDTTNGHSYEGRDASTPINILDLEATKTPVEMTTTSSVTSRTKGDAPPSNQQYNGRNLLSSPTYDPHAAFPDGAMILSTDDLRKLASRRRSHSSLLMQELFRKSSKNSRSSMILNGVGDVSTVIPELPSQSTLENDHDTKDFVRTSAVITGSVMTPTTVTSKTQQDPPSTTSLPDTSPASTGGTGSSTATSPALSGSGGTGSGTGVSSLLAQPPEHMVIAIRLLRAHKCHVDQIMETLKIEMDTLRDFDRLLEEPGRPTEEEVLNYFESVGLCLDQRFVVGKELQSEMDRISRGEPPEL